MKASGDPQEGFAAAKMVYSGTKSHHWKNLPSRQVFIYRWQIAYKLLLEHGHLQEFILLSRFRTKIDLDNFEVAYPSIHLD